MPFAVADQILAPHSPQGCSQHWPIVGIMVPQEGFVQTPDLESLGYHDIFAGRTYPMQGILTGMVHRRGARHRRRQKCLDLVGAITILF